MKKIISLLYFSVLICSHLISQVTGIVLDSKTGEPIAFAHVQTIQNQIGSLTDVEGFFTLYLQSDNAQNDSLLISYIGYKEQKISIEQIVNIDDHILLEEEVYNLEEVAILGREFDEIELIKRAMLNRPKTSVQKNMLMEAFYREQSMISPRALRVKDHISEGKKGKEIKEAVVNVFKSGYSSKDKNQVKLLKSRRVELDQMEELMSDSLLQSTLQNFQISGSLLSALNQDLKDESLDFLKKFKRYEYNLARVESYAGEKMLVIKFDQKERINKSLYKGEIFISEKDEAIVSLNYESSPRGLEHMPGLKLFGVHLKLLNQSGKIQYKKHDGKWLHSYSSTSAKVMIKLKKDKAKRDFYIDADFEVKIEMLMTANLKENVQPFPESEIMGKKDALQIEDELDPEFWNGYNTIPY